MRIVSMLTMMLLAYVAIAGSVFRSIDDDGQVIFSDRPAPNGQNETVDIDIVRSNKSFASEDKANESDVSAADKNREELDRKAFEEQQKLQPVTAQEKAVNCATAMNKQQRYNSNHRLYKELPDSVREYLSDDEIDAARADAARTVEKWCS
jgi:uncharacterized protein (UPF0128 family)